MRCQECKSIFTQRYIGQQYCCQTPECAQLENELKKAKQAERNEKAKLKPSKPLKRTAINPSAKPIAKRSKKRIEDDKVYFKKRKAFLALPENKICNVSGLPAVEIHHIFSGKDRDKYYLDESTWMAVSRKGHNWIHEHSKEARELGYLK